MASMGPDPYAALAELAGGFIHEVKNHLSTLGLNLQLLAEDFQEPQSQRERRALTRVQKLQGECQRLVDVANDFLRFARIKDLVRKPADLGRVIEEIVDFFTPSARAALIEIKVYMPADLPGVLLDIDMFKQALLNLMLNAKQAMPEGGELTIQAAAERGEGRPGSGGVGSPAPSAGGAAAGSGDPRRAPAPTPVATEDDTSAPLHTSYVSLSLIDTGQGMTPEVLAKLFRPFFSTRPGGTGLGLPTTRRIVEAHHGTIDVQSDVGKGTKFTIRLPAAPSQEAEGPPGTCTV